MDMADEYNHQIADGKWDHMMDQTHIGYTYWQQPPRMPCRRWRSLGASGHRQLWGRH